MIQRKSIQLKSKLIIPIPETDPSLSKISAEERSEFWFSARGDYSPTLNLDPIADRPHSARNQFSTSKTSKELPKVIRDNKVYSGLKTEDYLENMIFKLKDFTLERKLKTRAKKKKKSFKQTNLASASLESPKFFPVQSLVIKSFDSPSFKSLQEAASSSQIRVSLGTEPRHVPRLPHVGQKRKEMNVKKKKIVFSSPQPVLEDKAKVKKPFTPFPFMKSRKRDEIQKPLSSYGKGFLTVSSFGSGNIDLDYFK